MTTSVDVIVVPYDSGKRSYRMGAGPIVLVEHGIEQTIRDLGCPVSHEWVESSNEDPLASAVDLAARVADSVRRSRQERRFPVVLAGNCITTVGAFAGAGHSHSGLAWLDAHGDLNTPVTSPSGFLDGMALATLLGWCHGRAFEQVLQRWSMPDRNLLLIGGRSFDPAERQAIASGTFEVLSPSEASDGARRADRIARFAEPLQDVYVHLDLDVLDPEECGPANSLSVPGGLGLEATIQVLRDLSSHLPLTGLTLSAYEPGVDRSDRVREAAFRLIGEAVDLAREGTGLEA